jgi:hypothetical protein
MMKLIKILSEVVNSAEISDFGKRVHRYKITYRNGSFSDGWGDVISVESFERLKPSEDPVKLLTVRYKRLIDTYDLYTLNAFLPVTAIKCVRDTSRAGIGYEALLSSNLRVIYTPLDIDQKYFHRYYQLFQQDPQSREVVQFIRDWMNQNVFQYTLAFNQLEDWDTEGMFTARHY